MGGNGAFLLRERSVRWEMMRHGMGGTGAFVR